MATLGAAALLLWLANWCWIMKMILEMVPNWRDDDLDTAAAVEQAMMDLHMDPKRIKFLKAIVDQNPYLFWIGLILMAFSFTV